MPRFGETFINAIGVEVTAHGGSTPGWSDPMAATLPDQATNSANVHRDVFGRDYDPSVPVFLPTGTHLVIDRLAMVGQVKGSPFGGLIDIDSLIAYAARKQHVWNPTEHGMPPQSWLDANSPALTPTPGYGDGTDPTALAAPSSIEAPVIVSLGGNPEVMSVLENGIWSGNPYPDFPGPNILTDPDLDDPLAWEATLPWVVQNGRGEIDGTQDGGRSLLSNLPLSTAGQDYVITFNIAETFDYPAGNVAARIGAVQSSFVGPRGSHSFRLTGDGGKIGVRANSTFNGYVDNITAGHIVTPSFTYQWQRDGVDISGETGSTYTTDFGTDYGKQITCVVTAHNSEGTASASSNSLVPAYDGRHNLIPEPIAANSGFEEGVAGKLINTEAGGEVIAILRSWGTNWCQLDLDPVGTEKEWPGVSSVTITFSGAWEGTGTLNNSPVGYSYAGNVPGIQAGLLSVIGETVFVKIEPN